MGYMVVPETSDGTQGPAFVLDPSQLAHLQALAQPYLQNSFRQFYYNTAAGPEHQNQPHQQQQQMQSSVSGQLDTACNSAVSSNAVQSTADCGTDCNSQGTGNCPPVSLSVGGGGAASTGLLSSPSIDEEIARLHLGESDGETDPQTDIAAAAAATPAAATSNQAALDTPAATADTATDTVTAMSVSSS